MIKEATILDLAEIEELMSELEGINCHEYVRHTLLHPNYHWFYKVGTAMVYDPMDNGRFNMHIYNKSRGDRRLRDWCIRTGSWIFDNTEAKNLINFVKIERRDLRFFMASIGSVKVGQVGDELIYNISREDRARAERRLEQ